MGVGGSSGRAVSLHQLDPRRRLVQHTIFAVLLARGEHLVGGQAGLFGYGKLGQRLSRRLGEGILHAPLAG